MARWRRRIGMLGWRGLVIVGGALLLVVAGAVALDVVTVPQASIVGGTSGDAAVAGHDGVYPTGRARDVAVAVRNPAASAFAVTGVTVDLSALPAGCPASAWEVATPDRLPTVPGRGTTTLAVTMALTADAPDACQGLTAHLPVTVSGRQESGGCCRAASIESLAEVTVATLGTPTAALGTAGGRLSVEPVAAAAGPVPSAYEIDSDRTVLCTVSSAGGPPCTDGTDPAAAIREVTVVAHLGTTWHRASLPVTTTTPPPAPALTARSSSVLLSAGAAANGYAVDLVADGSGTPFRTVSVPATGVSLLSVSLPSLGTGDHRIVALARYRTRTVASAAVTVPARWVGTDGSAWGRSAWGGTGWGGTGWDGTGASTPSATTVPTSDPTATPAVSVPAVSVPAVEPSTATSPTAAVPSAVAPNSAAARPQPVQPTVGDTIAVVGGATVAQIPLG